MYTPLTTSHVSRKEFFASLDLWQGINPLSISTTVHHTSDRHFPHLKENYAQRIRWKMNKNLPPKPTIIQISLFTPKLKSSLTYTLTSALFNTTNYWEEQGHRKTEAKVPQQKSKRDSCYWKRFGTLKKEPKSQSRLLRKESSQALWRGHQSIQSNHTMLSVQRSSHSAYLTNHYN